MALVIPLYCDFVVYLYIKHNITFLLTLNGRFLLRILLVFGLFFAYLVNGFFFTIMFMFIDIPSYILGFLASGGSHVKLVGLVEGTGGCGGPENTAQKDLGGWRRMKLCPTEDISEFELENHGSFREDKGCLEVSRERLESEVKLWVDGIVG